VAFASPSGYIGIYTIEGVTGLTGLWFYIKVIGLGLFRIRVRVRVTCGAGGAELIRIRICGGRGAWDAGVKGLWREGFERSALVDPV
jgi:hypothetical protein